MAEGAAPASAELERVFADCFAEEFRTVLEGGGEEPLYVPSSRPDISPHRIVYRADYFASALHEVAHWCLAGAERRTREDYGYWYAPDGRDGTQQAEFERVEARPQALEWIFSDACGFDFHLSADNLEGDICAFTVGEFSDLGGHVLIFGVQCLISPQFSGDGQSFFVQIDGDHLRGTGRPGCLKG